MQLKVCYFRKQILNHIKWFNFKSYRVFQKHILCPRDDRRGDYVLPCLSVLPSVPSKNLYNQLLPQFFEKSISNLAKLLQTYWRCAPAFFWKRIRFWQNRGLFKLRLFWFWPIPDDKLVHQLPHSFLAISLKLCVFVADTLKICTCLVKEKNIIFWQYYSLFKLRNFSGHG